MSRFKSSSKKSDAYEMGASAYQVGEPSSLNPFLKVNMRWRDEWYDGWNDAWLEDIWDSPVG
jgi:hypothetical protein